MPTLTRTQTVLLTGAVAALSLGVIVRKLKSKRRPARRRVIVCSTPDEWQRVADEVLEAASEGLIGLDCEWVSSKHYRGKVALLQLAVSEELCVLIRLCRMELPAELREVLSDHNVIKFGVAVQDDADKLFKDFDIRVNSCLDIRYMLSDDKGTTSLAALAYRYAGMTLDKSLEIRTSDWEAPELSDTQIDYAADDAFAGLRVASALLDGWSFQNKYERCISRYWQYAGIAYRKGPPKCKKIASLHIRNRPVPHRKNIVRKDQKLYKNSVLQAPDGEILCSTDETKTQWYLKMGLATLVSEDPKVVRLNFEPRCRAILGGEYYIEEKLNICVVCGTSENLVKKNVVPQEYRKLFPMLMKSHTSHDSVLMCTQCHHYNGMMDNKLRSALDDEFPLTIEVPNILLLKRAARALQHSFNDMHAESQAEARSVLENYFKQPVTDEVLKNALNLDVQSWLRQHNATHAQRVIEGYSKNQGLFALESRWRAHFLKYMKPKYLPAKWSITHNHDAVLMKVATGRSIGEHTIESFLAVLGVNWSRLADVVSAIIEEGFVEPEKVVIWDLLKSKGFSFDYVIMKPDEQQKVRPEAVEK